MSMGRWSNVTTRLSSGGNPRLGSRTPISDNEWYLLISAFPRLAIMGQLSAPMGALMTLSGLSCYPLNENYDSTPANLQNSNDASKSQQPHCICRCRRNVESAL